MFRHVNREVSLLQNLNEMKFHAAVLFVICSCKLLLVQPLIQHGLKHQNELPTILSLVSDLKQTQGLRLTPPRT